MLKIEHATKRFGGLTAVDDVTLNLGDTSITGLIGPNGSGKTTLFHLITGFYALDEGDIHFGNKRITGRSPHAISRMGMIRTFQHTRVLPFLTTLDNLLAAAPNQAGERLNAVFFKPRRVRQEERALRSRAEEILKVVNLDPLAHELAGRLSYGQQKLLEIGRILMGRPRLILLDEPTAGINPTLIRQLVGIIHTLKDKGIRIFLIEHNMPLVSEICERIFVMDSGRLIFSGLPQEARQDTRVIEAYLGREDHAA